MRRTPATCSACACFLSASVWPLARDAAVSSARSAAASKIGETLERRRSMSVLAPVVRFDGGLLGGRGRSRDGGDLLLHFHGDGAISRAVDRQLERLEAVGVDDHRM